MISGVKWIYILIIENKNKIKDMFKRKILKMYLFSVSISCALNLNL